MVEVKVLEKEACLVQLDVTAPLAMIEEARKRAAKVVGKEVSLPGFRKGKAPVDMILQKFSKEVDKQLHKELADLAFVDAQKQVKVPLLNNKASVSFELKQLDEKGAKLLFSFETEPKVPVATPQGFSLKAIERQEVTDKQIDEAILQMRFFYAQWKPVTERPIQDGDYIMIDLDTVDGDKVERVFNHIRFEVSKDRMAEWMKKLVQGAKVGDVLEGVSEPDASEEETFPKKNVRITILKVEEAELPELNDEFAKKVGSPDIEQMRKSVADLFRKQWDEKVEQAKREQVNAFLMEQYVFDLPQSLVNAETKHRFEQLMQDPKFKTQWNHMSSEEKKQFEDNVKKEASQAVRLFYLSRAIVQNEKIPITHQEVQQVAQHLYQTHGGRSAENLPKELYALALSKVILAKAQDHFLKNT